ncbi:unnamed protein product [Thelazia callipaeda]|uniref:Solute carrier family 35 member B4 n=1 Tax=Thelazia callipaeda TaxID=103827 RepID=A0A0N5D183_THECL|nr:unnamed protein product [Thelazia callipaeda]
MMKCVVGSVLTACVGCMVTVEAITKLSPNCMNLLTCSTFLFISFIGFLKQSQYFKHLPRNKIPLIRGYLRVVILFFVINVANNLSLQYDISVPLLIIFRSGTLLANIILGYCLRSRAYSWKKLLSVLLITAGVVLFTFADKFPKHTVKHVDAEHRHSWFISGSSTGILLLFLAVFLSAYLGIYQEDLYRTYGNHYEEAMFFVVRLTYLHVLSLPGFVLFYSDIRQAVSHFNSSDFLRILGLQLPISSLWIYLILNCLFQWICVKNVYTLTSLTTSLNVTVVVTLRKFLSMIISVVAFKNPFTILHFIGTVFVLLGSVVYTTCDLRSAIPRSKME